MPRIGLILRAACRAAIALSIFPKTRDSDGGHFPSRSLTCPYCSKTLQSRAARDRHSIMKAYCHERHLHRRNYPNTKRRKPKRKRHDPDRPSIDEPTLKHPRTDDAAPPLPGTESAQPAIDGSADGLDSGPHENGDERICGPPFVEKFPVSTAGAPISSETKSRPNLRKYLESCGKLGDPKTFATAELLMMTVPKSKDRTLHLQSDAVSMISAIQQELHSLFEHVSTRERRPGRTIGH